MKDVDKKTRILRTNEYLLNKLKTNELSQRKQTQIDSHKWEANRGCIIPVISGDFLVVAQPSDLWTAIFHFVYLALRSAPKFKYSHKIRSN